MKIKLRPGAPVEIRSACNIAAGLAVSIRKDSKGDVKAVVSMDEPADYSDGTKLHNRSPGIIDGGLDKCWVVALDIPVTITVNVATALDNADSDAYQIGYGVNALYALSLQSAAPDEPLIGDFVKSARGTMAVGGHTYELLTANQDHTLSLWSYNDLLYNSGASNPAPIPGLPTSNVGSYLISNEWTVYYFTINGEAYDVWATTFTPYTLTHTTPVKVYTLPNSGGYQMRTLQVVTGTPGFWMWSADSLCHFNGTTLTVKYTNANLQYLTGPRYSSRPCHSFTNQNGGPTDSYGLVYLDAAGNGHTWTLSDGSYENIHAVVVNSGVTPENPDGNRFYISRPNGCLYRATPNAAGVITTLQETISTEMPQYTDMYVAGTVTGAGDSIWVHGYGVYLYVSGNQWIQPSVRRIGNHTVNNPLSIVPGSGTMAYPKGGELVWDRGDGTGLHPITKLPLINGGLVDYVQLTTGQLVMYAGGAGFCGYSDWNSSHTLRALSGAGIYDKVVARKLT